MSSEPLDAAEKQKFDQFFLESGGPAHQARYVEQLPTINNSREEIQLNDHVRVADGMRNESDERPGTQPERREDGHLHTPQRRFSNVGTEETAILEQQDRNPIHGGLEDGAVPIEQSASEDPQGSSTEDGSHLPIPGPGRRSKFFGQTSQSHTLYGTAVGEHPHYYRWSEHDNPKAEEEILLQKARNYAIIHRKTSLETPVRGQIWETHSFEIQSPRLRQFLKKVLHGYPHLDLDAPTLEFKPPFSPLLHRWNQLKEEKPSQNGATLQEIDLLEKSLMPELAASRETLQKLESTGKVEWEDLGHVFSPGDLLFARGSDPIVLYRLEDIIKYDEDDVDDDESPFWELALQQVDWNGRRFGYHQTSSGIDWFSGANPISKFTYFPLKFQPNEEEIRTMLLDRGKKFEQLHGFRYMAYNGNKYTRDWDRPTHDEPRELTKPLSGRVIVDALAYHRFEYNCGVRFRLDSLSEKGEESQQPGNPDERHEEAEPLTEEQHLIAVPRVKGFDLKENEWCEFDVKGVSEIEFKEDSFQKLVLPAGEKKLLKAFMGREELQRSGWDDIIPNKGKGVIVLLYGPPGVGKTLTAESVSETSKAPLYSLNASDIGTDAAQAEVSLKAALDCCQMWKAVLLIDEADVFLQARSMTAISQNELVSVFLRRLEYYQGFLFMTTNRYSCIDEAFKSRIDLILPFEALDQATRKSIWKTFIDSIPETDRDISSDDLEALTAYELNGREIKNMVKSARFLAHSEKLPLRLEHLDILLGIRKRIAAAERDK